ncbi:hypothetical protein RE9431_36600 [Prescottella equi]|nr:hypothetical protein RE9425_37220 [Prescottella equi]BCN65205.1 hypothetical protein RE9431_36600 [Prescottella equi]
MRYIRSPGAHGSATNRSDVRSERPRYPRASCAPETYSSPTTPAGTGFKRESRTRTWLFHTGAPIGTAADSVPATVRRVTWTAVSVGP